MWCRAVLGERTETTQFYNNSGLFLPSPSSLGFPSFPNSCRCSSCQNLTATDQSLADFAFGSGRHYKTEAVAKVALSPLFSFFPTSCCHSVFFQWFLLALFFLLLLLPTRANMCRLNVPKKCQLILTKHTSSQQRSSFLNNSNWNSRRFMRLFFHSSLFFSPICRGYFSDRRRVACLDFWTNLTSNK